MKQIQTGGDDDGCAAAFTGTGDVLNTNAVTLSARTSGRPVATGSVTYRVFRPGA